ncbi:MAG: hypothetical protein AAF371_17930 [Pseudomonadota bacterium]
MVRSSLTLLFFALFGWAASGQDATPCPMTNAQFDLAIPHLDIATCPAPLNGEDQSCRAPTSDDQGHVLAFEAEGEQCVIAMTSLDEHGFQLMLK